MRITAVDHRLVRWPIAARGAARGLGEREAVLITVHDDSGATGIGEAAPLPGMSIDRIEDALAAAEALAAHVPFEIETARHASALAGRLTAAPAASFAIETALVCALAQMCGVSVASMLSPIPQAELAYAYVVDDEDEARRAIGRGARCLKIKVGTDLDHVRRIAAAAPGCRLRLDANRAWRREDVPAILAQLRDLPIDHVEEPCVDAVELLAEPLAHRLALDESLIDLDSRALVRALRSPRLAALVLKPTLLGGLARCLELAATAHRHGVAPIVTHTLEGPVGFAACYELARAIGADVPVGLAPYAETRRGCRTIIATHTQQTVDAIRDAWRACEPIALLHAKASGEEQLRQCELVDHATVHDGDAFVLFTSGSTGPSRGVVHTRRSVISAARASETHLGWRDGDRWLCCLPLAHAGGLSIILRCLLADREVLLSDDPREIRDATLASLVPAQLSALLDDPTWRAPAQLRAVLLGGAAAPRSLVDAAIARGVPLLLTYGLTETFGQIATARAPGELPVPLRDVTIRGGSAEAPALLRVRGPMLASRYLDGTPIAPELVTADLGHVDAYVHVVGRADDVIISGGENVHPTQIEAVLAMTPGVRDVAAFGVPDARWGHVVAAAVATNDEFDRDAALARWHAALPPHARPRRLVTLDALPRLPSGKVDRRSIARLPTCPIEYA